jgi:hypothetical protein
LRWSNENRFEIFTSFISIGLPEAQVVGRGLSLAFLGVIVAVTATVAGCAQTPPAPGPAVEKPALTAADDQPRVPNEYLVTLAPDADDRVISERYGRFGIKYLHALEAETFLLILSNDPGPRKMEAVIEGESRIKLVQPNIIYWDYR